MHKYVNGVLVDLTPEEIAAIEEAQNQPPTVPQLIEMRKAIVQMHETPWGEGTLLEAVEAALASHPDIVALEWERATTLSRTRDIVVAMQQALGLSDATMDALFIAANARP